MTGGGFAEEDWTRTADIRTFAEILSVIIVGASDGQSERDSNIPTFVSDLINQGLFANSRTRESLRNIFNTLQQNGFSVVNGVDSDEVFASGNWVESSERERQSKRNDRTCLITVWTDHWEQAMLRSRKVGQRSFAPVIILGCSATHDVKDGKMQYGLKDP
jgi:hypothetical protein